MSRRTHLKPRIKLVDGAWEAIPPTAVHVPNLMMWAEQFCAVLNMDGPETATCGCGATGEVNYDDGTERRYYCYSALSMCSP